MTTKLRIKMNETAGLKNFLQILNKVGKISQLNFIIGAYDTNNETMKKIESKVQKTEEHYLKIKLNRFCEFLDNEDSLIWGVFIGCDEDNELHIDNNIVSEGAPDDLQAENGIIEARVNDGLFYEILSRDFDLINTLENLFKEGNWDVEKVLDPWDPQNEKEFNDVLEKLKELLHKESKLFEDQILINKITSNLSNEDYKKWVEERVSAEKDEVLLKKLKSIEGVNNE